MAPWSASVVSALLISTAFFFAVEGASTDGSGFVITRADRKIDLSSQFARISLSLKVENKGQKAESRLLIGLPSELAGHLSHISAVATTGKGKTKTQGPPLEVTSAEAPASSPLSDVSYFAIKFDPVAAGASAAFEVAIVLTETMTPFPSEIAQSERQLVVYKDTAKIISPNQIKSQSTKVSLPSTSVQEFTKVNPSGQSGAEIKYGPYEDTPPYDFSPVRLHFENTRPFVVADELVREIDVSHWGTVYITETYKLEHTGARHKGSFSRLDYQMRPDLNGASAVKELKAIFPATVHSVYYRDEIGNISTSRLREGFWKTELELEPRYPLLGGWKVSFIVGYRFRLRDVITYNRDGSLSLNLTFGCPFPELGVRRLFVKVALPEGSSDISVKTPFDVKESRSVKFRFLDVMGGPLVILSKDNVVAEHNQYFQVTYHFGLLGKVREAVIVLATGIAIVLGFVLYSNSDFTIAKNTESYQRKMQQDEVSEGLSRLLRLLTLRERLVGQLESSVRSCVDGGDPKIAVALRKEIDVKVKDSAKDLKSVVDLLEANPRASSRIAKVQTIVAKDKEVVDKALQRHIVVVEGHEKNASQKEIQSREAPLAAKLQQSKAELKSLKQELEE